MPCATADLCCPCHARAKTWRKPPSSVHTKVLMYRDGTFGMPDQGQMLDV
jgi:hypothetical protein